jgi:hypothetical protein
MGQLFGVVGSAIWIRGGIFRPDLTQETSLFLGRNPFQVKAAIRQRWENVVAFTWIALSFLLSLFGTMQSARNQKLEMFWAELDAPVLILVFLSVGVALYLLSVKFSKWFGMRRATPLLVNLQRHLIARAAHVLRHGGLRENQLIPGVIVSEEQKEKQLAEARRRLDQVGSLLEVPRRVGEEDAGYVERLEAFAQRYPAAEKWQ